MKKTHPDKYLSTLAYENYFWHPALAIEPNVAVAPCLAVRNHWHLTYRENELTQYQKWVQDKRPTFLWNYYCFPEEPSVITLIEETYSNPDNWPQNAGFHQTEALAWGALGTEARMAKLKAYMDEAQSAEGDPLIKTRIERWRLGVWQYMASGREHYLRKLKLPPPAP